VAVMIRMLTAYLKIRFIAPEWSFRLVSTWRPSGRAVWRPGGLAAVLR
jgi:hypothetical protein